MQFFQREVFLFEPQKILAKLIFTFTVEGNLPPNFFLHTGFCSLDLYCRLFLFSLIPLCFHQTRPHRKRVLDICSCLMIVKLMIVIGGLLCFGDNPTFQM